MKIAFFAVLHPIRSGVANYCHNLLPKLKELVELDIFIDDYDTDDEAITSQFEVMNYLRFEERLGSRRYDAIIYELGNDAHYKFMYHYIFNFPGIVVLHDFNLHPSRASMLRASADEETYRRELEACVGPKGSEIARLVCAGEQFNALLNTFPMNEKVLRSSRAVIVHNPYVKRLVEKAAPETPAYLVNMGLPQPGRALGRGEARRRLNLPQSNFIVLNPGFVGPHRKPEVVIDGFAQFVKKHPKSMLIFTGEPDPRVDLPQMVSARGLSNTVRLEHYVRDEVFHAYIAAADVVLNLRTNAIRETSATMLTAMSLGRPVIATRLAHNCYLPAGVCLFVEHSPTEANDLAVRLEELWSNPKRGEAIGKAARAYVRENHSLGQAAQGYKAVIDAVVSQPKKGTRRPRTLGERLPWLAEEKARLVEEMSAPEHGKLIGEVLEEAMSDLGLGK
ncbi:MAG: hypothetical protein DRH70_06325 [Candidatus Coatesbacteria bacterium]|nr:MAG: hypothetical protein DRH70_06325 [Candidatus Coatesbacteria bacterium]